MSRSSERFLRTVKSSSEEYDGTGQYKTDSLRSLRRPTAEPMEDARTVEKPDEKGLFEGEFTTGD